MRTAFLTLCLVCLAACASAPPVVPLPRPAVQMEAPPPPPTTLPERAAIEPMIIAPPPVPKLRIAQRSVYDRERLALWTLENGLPVLYAWDDDAGRYTVSVSGPSADGSRARIVETADSYDDAISQALALVESSRGPLAEVVVAVHGPLSSEWMEASVASVLGAPNVRRGLGIASRPVVALVDVDWDDLAAITIAAAVVADRPGDAALFYDAERGTAALVGDASVAALDAVDAIQAARALATDRAQSGLGIVETLDAWYRLPGRYRPARPPSAVRGLPARIQRTPLDRVNRVLARLRAAIPVPE